MKRIGNLYKIDNITLAYKEVTKNTVIKIVLQNLTITKHFIFVMFIKL